MPGIMNKNDLLRALTVFNLGCKPTSILEKYGFNLPQQLTAPLQQQPAQNPPSQQQPAQNTPPPTNQSTPQAAPGQLTNSPAQMNPPTTSPQQANVDAAKKLQQMLAKWNSPIV